MLRFQSSLPSFRERQISHCSFCGSGLITNTRSPQIIGVAPEMPGRSAAHFTPSVGLNCVGKALAGAVPFNAGPRHCGQFSACSERVSAQARTRVWSFMEVNGKTMSLEDWLHNPARGFSL